MKNLKGIECIEINGQIIFQQNTIGIQDNNNNKDNKDKPFDLQCNKEG